MPSSLSVAPNRNPHEGQISYEPPPEMSMVPPSDSDIRSKTSFVCSTAMASRQRTPLVLSRQCGRPRGSAQISRAGVMPDGDQHFADRDGLVQASQSGETWSDRSLALRGGFESIRKDRGAR